MTSLVVDNRVITSQNMKLDLINNVVNRIALSDNATLTYQDQVYITNMLQKLGIQDIASFMTNIRQMKTEQVQSQKLVQQYRDTVLEYVGRTREPEPLPQPGTTSTTVEGDSHLDQNWFLHQEIYRRLGTIENIYQMEQFTTSIEGESLRISRTQMLQSEYMRMANALLLAEYRSYVTQEPHTPTTVGVNPYEYQGALEEMTTQEITAQLTQSVLFHTFSQLFSSRIQHYMEGDEFHYDLSRALHQTAENTVRRFEQFHSEGRMVQASFSLQQTALNQLLSNESNLLAHYNGFVQYTADEQRYLEQNSALWQENRLNMTYLSQFSQENLEEYQWLAGDTTIEQTHVTQEGRKESQPGTQDAPAQDKAAQTKLVERQKALTKLFRRELLHGERVEMQSQMASHLHNLFQIMETMAYLRQQDTVQILALRNFNVTQEEWLVRQAQLSNTVAYVQQLEQNYLESQMDFHHQDVQLEESQTVEVDNSTAQTTALTQYLDEINQENIKKREIMQQTLARVSMMSPQAVLPDLAKTKELAMLSIQSPEKLREFLAKAEAVDTTKPVNAQLEAILSVLDPMTRSLMEQAMYRTEETSQAVANNIQQNTNLVQLITDVTQSQPKGLDIPKPIGEQIQLILNHADLETRMLVEQLLEQTIAEQSSATDEAQPNVTLTQLMTELTRLELALTPGQPGAVGGAGRAGQDGVTMTHTVAGQTVQPNQAPPRDGVDGQPGTSMASEQVHQESHQLTTTRQVLEQMYGDLEHILQAEVLPPEVQKQVLAETIHRETDRTTQEQFQDVVTESQSHTTQLEETTRQHHERLERIYGAVETFAPSQRVLRLVQEELWEFTSHQETMQTLAQLDATSEQAYHQVVRQFQSLQKEEKEQVLHVLLEKTQRQTQSTAVTQREQLEYIHHHMDTLYQQEYGTQLVYATPVVAQTTVEVTRETQINQAVTQQVRRQTNWLEAYQQARLEQIYRHMDVALPARAVVRLIQRELMEYTNVHETRQAFDRLEVGNERVYAQVVRQYESVEKEQKERLMQVLTEKTTRQREQETLQVETLQLEHRTTMEQVSEQISQTIADILYGAVSAVGPEYAETVVRQSVPMVLKRMETEMPEELTELLETKNVTQVTKEEFEVVRQEETTTTVQPNKLEAELKAHDAAENVRKMVEKSIKSQVSTITDQVYQKLERRLQMERARRGK